MPTITLLTGDCLSILPTLEAASVQTVVTSPPYYGLRDYGVDGQIGLEQSPAEYVEKLVAVFREVRRVLKDDGTLWLNLGDSYANTNPGSGGKCTLPRAGKNMTEGRHYNHKVDIGCAKPKDLLLIPARVAIALQADGWYLRSDIIWHKPNPMPESVTDRPTKAHEYIFLLAKSERYFYDADAISETPISAPRKREKQNGESAIDTKLRGNNGACGVEGNRNRRSVWTVPTHSYSGAHFATFPPKLIEPCILAGSAEGDTVLDPFSGSGTTGMVSVKHHRNFIGIELNPAYVELAKARVANVQTSISSTRITRPCS